jgi:cytochrome c556
MLARFHFRNRPVGKNGSYWSAALLAAAGLWLCANAPAQVAPRPEALIKWRQSAYQVIAWNSGRIKSALAGKYDSHEVRSAATALAAVANSGLPGLFAPGTAEGKGWRATTARPEVFGDVAKFRALNDEFARETSELARIAAGGEPQAVRQQFLKVAQACKSCHDRFRQTD